MSELPDTCRHPRGLAARRAADRGSDPVVGQARTARGRRRHRRPGDRGDRVRLPVEGARARRRRRTGRRAAPTSTTSSSPPWSPARTAPSARSPPACTPSSTWCRPPTATAAPTSGDPPRRPTAQIAEIVAIAHDSGATVEVIVATAWDCPFDGPTPPQRVLDIVTAARDNGVDRLAIADTIGTTTPRRVSRPGRPGPPADRRHPARRALPQHPRRRAGQRVRRGHARASPGSTPRSAASAAARSRRARAATSPPRTWSTCCATAEFTSTSTWTPRSRRPASRRPPSATTCPSALLRAGDRLLGE